jgi:hypothetical protein
MIYCYECVSCKNVFHYRVREVDINKKPGDNCSCPESMKPCSCEIPAKPCNCKDPEYRRVLFAAPHIGGKGGKIKGRVGKI